MTPYFTAFRDTLEIICRQLHLVFDIFCTSFVGINKQPLKYFGSFPSEENWQEHPVLRWFLTLTEAFQAGFRYVIGYVNLFWMLIYMFLIRLHSSPSEKANKLHWTWKISGRIELKCKSCSEFVFALKYDICSLSFFAFATRKTISLITWTLVPHWKCSSPSKKWKCPIVSKL